MAKPSKPTDGFTIIELLIVMAVAGVIFMIIFNAIPALMRNSRNNQRNQDVAAVLNSISQYQLNHSGNFPPTSGDHFLDYAKITFYETGKIVVNPTQTIPTGTPQDDEVQLYNYALCNTRNNGATGSGAGYRDIVALYMIEGSSSTTVRCQQL